MSSSVTTSIYLDKRQPRKDGTLSIKLRVTHQRIQKYCATGMAMHQEDFDKVMGPKPRGIHKDNQLRFAAIEQKAQEIIARLDPFTFPEFARQFRNKPRDRRDVFEMYDAYIESLWKEDKVKTAKTYEASLKSIRAHWGRDKLAFTEITPEWLQAYEAWLIERQKRTTTTLSIYLRCLRSIFNQAIKNGNLQQSLYPFGKHKYIIPQGRNIKKALALADVKKIFQYEPEPESAEARYRDYWLFSYLCNGINVKDMGLLRYRDIGADSITFIRAKTKHSTRRGLKPIVVPLLPPVRQIIDQWGNKPVSPDAFVFPILTDGLTAAEETARIQQEGKQINKYIRRVGAALGIEKDITTYTARHTFSTVLKRSGAPLELISESLGHTNLTTTERYLDSFEDDVKRGFAERLLDFGDD